MPRIAKWKEKNECVKFLAPKPVKFVIADSGEVAHIYPGEEYKSFDETTPYSKIYATLYDLIDKTIEEAMAKGYKPVDDVSQFISIKEVPNG